MMMWLRAIVFNSAFYGWTFFISVLFFPFLIFSRSIVLKIIRFWIHGVVWICENILGLYITIRGKEKLLSTPAIFAVKHQSAWETMILHYILFDPSIVLKRELLWIPFFGWFLKRLGMVSVSRTKGKGTQDIRNLLKAAERAIARGQSVVIFPEGTRSHPGQKETYQSGVASLYLHLKIPVIPIAHNAGLFWPRRGFFKYPGYITLEILDPIEPGLSRREFMRILENKIESKTNDLIHEGGIYVSKA